jgi:hypothetical protein
MLPYAYYLLKVIICSAILTGYYWFMLRNKNFHGYNRFYLLASVILSLLLPLIKIDFWTEPKQTGVISVLQTVYYSDEYMENVVIAAPQHSWSITQFYPVLYLAVSVIMAFIFLQGIYLIIRLLRKYPSHKIDSISFINTEAKGTPFSFLRYIFWNDNIDINTTTGNQIFKHEVAHVQEKHTHDKLFMNIILIAFWCNPVFWFIRKELNMIHEFIADKKAVEDSDTSAFAAMILQATYPQHRFQLANNFFYSPIKRRLLMLTKNANPKVNYIGRILVLPLAILVFAAFTFKPKKTESAVAKPGNMICVSNIAEARLVLQNDFRQTLRLQVPDSNPKRLVTGIQLRKTTDSSKSVVLVQGVKITSANAEPLYIVDGKELPGTAMNSISPVTIKTINVIKGESAVATYGEKGKNGVIICTTKPNDETIKSVQVQGYPIAGIEKSYLTRDDRNVLYVGIDNPVTIGTYINTEDVAVEITQGSMIGKNGKYTVRVTTPGEATISLTNKKTGESLGKYNYTVKAVTEIKLVETLKKDVLAQPSLDEVTVIGYPTKKPELMATGIQPVFSKVEIESSFPGGIEAWKTYLRKNLDGTAPVNEGWKAGTYTIVVQFIVKADGSISNAKTTNYQNSKTAQQCINLIMTGPKWIPAMQNGKPVSSYRKQPITFVVEEEKSTPKPVTK